MFSECQAIAVAILLAARTLPFSFTAPGLAASRGCFVTMCTPLRLTRAVVLAHDLDPGRLVAVGLEVASAAGLVIQLGIAAKVEAEAALAIASARARAHRPKRGATRQAQATSTRTSYRRAVLCPALRCAPQFQLLEVAATLSVLSKPKLSRAIERRAGVAPRFNSSSPAIIALRSFFPISALPQAQLRH